MTVQEVLVRLKAVKPHGPGQWQARCPAHEDRNPSLSIKASQTHTLLHCHAGCGFDAVVSALGLKPEDLFHDNGQGRRKEIVDVYDYTAEDGEPLFQVVRFIPKGFRPRRIDVSGDFIWNLKGVRRVPFRLPQVIEAISLDKTIYVVEGEKDVRAIEKVGGVATCNPGGANNWRPEYSQVLRGARVRIVADLDEAGLKHARDVAASLDGIAQSVEVLGPAKGKDADDHVRGGLGLSDFEPLEEATGPRVDPIDPVICEAAEGVTLDDFYAYMPEHKYIYVPTRDLWPTSSVDARLPATQEGERKIKASQTLDRDRHVEQMSWVPGKPMIIEDRLISHGGWLSHPGVTCFNLYRPPTIRRGDPTKAGRWVDHTHTVFPESADHIIRWLAQRVQRPHEKINHALVLQGAQGTGKDSIIEGMLPAVGTWNAAEVSPEQLMQRFNGFVKSVILRVSEARDLGDTDRYRFYDHLKTYTAAPPLVLRVDEKNIREYGVPNVCGVIITTNYMDGIYLPADDRRHYVAWTDLTKQDFTEAYFNDLYSWYEHDGCRHIAAYLAELDISDFNPKAPPPKTTAFWNVVDAGRAPEDAELSDVLDKLQRPDAVTLRSLADAAEAEFGEWLQNRKNSRQIPHRMEAVGYVPVRNDAANDGRWKVGGRRLVVYGRRELSIRDRLAAVGRLDSR